MESNYDILGIEEGAGEREIRGAFRRLALQHHSDRGGEGEKFIRIKQAYEDLKAGKKYPDTEDERLGRARVYDEGDVRKRNEVLGREIAGEMARAGEWAAALARAGSPGSATFGSKALGEMEFEREEGGRLLMRGNYMAGSLEYGGTILARGSVSSPTWAPEFATRIRVTAGDFRMVDATGNGYRVENGARITVDRGNAVVGDVFGRKFRVDDPDGRVGVFDIVKRVTLIEAPRGAVVAEDAAHSVRLSGDKVIMVNAEDGVEIEGREVDFYGDQLTYDCSITLRRGGLLRFHARSILGLSGDAGVALDDGTRVRLFDLKTKKIRDLEDPPAGHGKDDTLVGSKFAITYGMIKEVAG
ncbi:MAG: DnaJ domain-containing protein [Nitrosopumilus sp.]|nr:DnaJ domain-containing protein [Nitrosopumilus sp.]